MPDRPPHLAMIRSRFKHPFNLSFRLILTRIRSLYPLILTLSGFGDWKTLFLAAVVAVVVAVVVVLVPQQGEQGQIHS